MIRRIVQRGFALGLTGLLGVMFIAGPASGLTARQAAEGIEPAGAAEGPAEQDLAAEEQEAMRAWVAAMEEGSPMGDTIKPNPECIEKYDCPHQTKCAFSEGTGVCIVTQCGDGKCGL
jgi:hypothetical protein